MKKKLGSIICLIFFFFSPLQISAQKEAITVEYNLPYPGILPGSTFYLLKTTRDRIEDFFISDPVKKIDFNINKADMRMAAADSLIEKKKSIVLAESTISKAENYFEEALTKTKEAKAQGKETEDIEKRLTLANQKYHEVIITIEKKIGEKEQKKLESVKKRLNAQQKTITQMKKIKTKVGI